MTWVLNQLKPPSTRSSVVLCLFYGALTGSSALAFFFCLVTELLPVDSGTHVVTLGYYLWLPLPRLSEPLSSGRAGCQSQAGRRLSRRHTRAYERDQVYTQTYTHINMDACRNGGPLFVDTNGGNVALLKVRSGEIRVAALH